MAINNDMEKLVSESERIGTIGSPSSTSELSLDILGTAVRRKLVGELAFFEFQQDGNKHYSIGQITEIELRNRWLEDSTIRSLARQRGQIDTISDVQDTHLGKMIISATFCDRGTRFEPSILGTVPPTGTYISIAEDDLIEKLLERYQDELFYLGRVYGSNPKLPLWFKHFDSGSNGAGEAYHLGVFGKTGSGKSVLAKMIASGYARHKNMAIFIIDPQGEFAKDYNNMQSIWPRIALKLGKRVRVLNIQQLILDTWELFEEVILESKEFFDRLTIKGKDYKLSAVVVLIDFLRKKKISLKDLYKEEVLRRLCEHIIRDDIINNIYVSKDTKERVKNHIKQILDDNNKFNDLYRDWKKICGLFRYREGAIRISNLMYSVFGDEKNRPIVIIDLAISKDSSIDFLWNDRIQALVIKTLLNSMNRIASEKYINNEQGLNTLVIFDEAHRFASRETKNDLVEEEVRRRLIDAVRTTRKYGLGWMFISQTLSSLDREIINQIRTFFFGFGLAQGSELNALKELVNDPNSIKLYQSFRDPASAFDSKTREHSFMTIGPVSPLSFSGTPLFFNAYTPEEFCKVNFDIKG